MRILDYYSTCECIAYPSLWTFVVNANIYQEREALAVLKEEQQALDDKIVRVFFPYSTIIICDTFGYIYIYICISSWRKKLKLQRNRPSSMRMKRSDRRFRMTSVRKWSRKSTFFSSERWRKNGPSSRYVYMIGLIMRISWCRDIYRSSYRSIYR
jgi:hypothetical protein